jgi:BirA family transcriptional regulator, biotin operon repressor / biotin---[acetyl-CoA-carboxylase] ligase
MHRTLMKQGVWNGSLLSFDSLPSTNKWALENMASLNHGDVVTAARQTSGYGRFGRPWFSQDEQSVTFSVVIKAKSRSEPATSIPGQLAALAVRSMLANHGIPALLKWPNDVLSSERKIAGILAEQDSQSDALVIGIGLNVNLTVRDFAALDLMQPATSMAIEGKDSFDVGAIRAELIAEVQKTFDTAMRTGPNYLCDTWNRSDALTDRHISISNGEETLSGTYAGMDQSGRLRIIDENGAEHLFWSGDVSLHR